jgi:hypothetical protein
MDSLASRVVQRYMTAADPGAIRIKEIRPGKTDKSYMVTVYVEGDWDEPKGYEAKHALAKAIAAKVLADSHFKSKMNEFKSKKLPFPIPKSPSDFTDWDVWAGEAQLSYAVEIDD